MQTNKNSNLAIENQLDNLNACEVLLGEILGATVGNIGNEFFDIIAEKIAKWFRAECVIIGQLVAGNRVNAMPLYLNGEIMKGYSYSLKGTPCDEVTKRNYCTFPDNVAQIFPEDSELVNLRARGYVGTTLHNKDGSINGILCVMSRNKLNISSQAENIFRILGARISAEIERQKEHEQLLLAKEKLKAKNDELETLTALLKNANNQLIDSEKRYRALFDNTKDPVSIFYNDRFINCNQATLDALLLNSKDDFRAVKPWEISPKFQPEGLSSETKAKEMIAIALKEGYHSFDWVHKNSRNVNRWYNVSLVRMVLDGKTILYTVWRDIHKRKQQEEELKSMSVRLSKAQEIGLVGYFEWFKSTDYVTGSDQYFMIFGAEQETHNCFNDFIRTVHPEDRESVKQALEKAMRHKEYYDVEYRIVLNKSTIKYIHAIGNFEFDNDGNAFYLLGMVHDITKQKEAEKIIKAREQHLNAIFKASQVGITLTRDRILIFANQYLCNMLGYKLEDVLGMESSEFYFNREEFELVGSNLEKGLKKGGSVLQESRFVTKEGEIVYVLIHSSFYNAEDVEGGIISVVTDITNQKNTEKELERLNREKNKFFSIIAHDLRGPLGSIMGLSELLAENYSKYEDDKKHMAVSEIYLAMKRTFNLLENLLTWSRNQLGRIQYNPERLGLHDFILESASVYQNSLENKEINLSVDVDQNIAVYADKQTIDSVIRNLVSNAIKFTHRKGWIKISASLVCAGNKTEISIENKGEMISKKVLAKLFKIEHNTSAPGTENERGTGLGLILCKEFVENNGGEIFAESERGKPTKFSFTLPSYVGEV